jgi:hypothetical protein
MRLRAPKRLLRPSWWRQLMHAATDAVHRLRPARGLELFERALAAAQALPLPRDSLVIAFCVSRLVGARTTLSSDAMAAATEPSQFKVALEMVWRDDARALLLAQRCLALYHARWRAGTLFTLTPVELAFFGHTSPVQICAEDYIAVAADAVSDWPPLRTPADEEARTHGVHGALRAALEMASQDDVQFSLDVVSALCKTMSRLHNDSAAGGGFGRISGARRHRRGALRPAPLRAAVLQRHGAGAQVLQALWTLPRRRVLQRCAQQGGLEAAQARGGLPGCTRRQLDAGRRNAQGRYEHDVEGVRAMRCPVALPHFLAVGGACRPLALAAPPARACRHRRGGEEPAPPERTCVRPMQPSTDRGCLATHGASCSFLRPGLANAGARALVSRAARGSRVHRRVCRRGGGGAARLAAQCCAHRIAR